MNLFSDQSPIPKRSQKITDEAVMSIYSLYPKKVGRKVALAAIRRALRDLIKEGCDDPIDTLEGATREYRDAVETWPEIDKQYIPMPASWFNQGRWEDDREEWYKGERKRPKPAGKILSAWEDQLKRAMNAVSSSQIDRDKWRNQASLKTLLAKVPERIKTEPSIAAVLTHAENML